MKQSITQESNYGCGAACYAFLCGMSYKQAVNYLGQEYSVKHGWRPSDITTALVNYGFRYKNNYVRKKPRITYDEGIVVLLERPKQYPVGHYLVMYDGKWMNPWINLTCSSDIFKAKSGFRNQLPGHSMYAITPLSS